MSKENLKEIKEEQKQWRKRSTGNNSSERCPKEREFEKKIWEWEHEESIKMKNKVKKIAITSYKEIKK